VHYKVFKSSLYDLQGFATVDCAEKKETRAEIGENWLHQKRGEGELHCLKYGLAFRGRCPMDFILFYHYSSVKHKKVLFRTILYLENVSRREENNLAK
jgi:hypothetical protein